MKQFIETLENLKVNETFKKDLKTWIKNSQGNFVEINQKTGVIKTKSLSEVINEEISIGDFKWDDKEGMFIFQSDTESYGLWKSEHFNFWELEIIGVGTLVQCSDEREIVKVLTDPYYCEDVEVPVSLNPVLNYMVQKGNWTYIFINAEFSKLLFNGHEVNCVKTLKQAYKLTTLTRDEE